MDHKTYRRLISGAYRQPTITSRGRPVDWTMCSILFGQGFDPELEAIGQRLTRSQAFFVYLLFGGLRNDRIYFGRLRSEGKGG